MKQLVTALFSIVLFGAFGQSAQIDNTLEFQISGGSATVANSGFEVRYSHRVNDHIELWNWEYFVGGGFWSRPGQFGPHALAAGRTAFGRKRHQVLGDLGGVILFDLSDGYNSYALPVLNLGYRYNSQTDDWHIQFTAGTWGLVSVNLGLKW
ncbi:MAG: hypothetical protein J4F31_04510 [Flavobacteriales bacterium]|nr:hypothetical protein [Flavobacteriales bacterium]